MKNMALLLALIFCLKSQAGGAGGICIRPAGNQLFVARTDTWQESEAEANFIIDLFFAACHALI